MGSVSTPVSSQTSLTAAEGRSSPRSAAPPGSFHCPTPSDPSDAFLRSPCSRTTRIDSSGPSTRPPHPTECVAYSGRRECPSSSHAPRTTVFASGST